MNDWQSQLAEADHTRNSKRRVFIAEFDISADDPDELILNAKIETTGIPHIRYAVHTYIEERDA